MMAGRGILLSLDERSQDKLSNAKSDREAVGVLLEIEELASREDMFDLDKAWNIIHRCLTDGRLEYDNGTYPLNMVVMAGIQIHESDERVISVVPDEFVSDIAYALRGITKEEFRKGYEKIMADELLKNQEDFEYSWEIFKGLPEFWEKAAEKEHAVVFNVDL